jgi:hypothetical protein
MTPATKILDELQKSKLMNKTIIFDGVEYNLVPVSFTQEATKENKFKVGDWVTWHNTEPKLKIWQIKDVKLNLLKFVGNDDWWPDKYFELAEQLKTEKPKPQTKYRKNGALIFAPEIGSKVFVCDIFYEIVEGRWGSGKVDNILLQQGLIFDNKEACQIWADKLKIAYALKQRIVESESEDDYLEKCVIWFSYDKKQCAYEWKIQDIDMPLIVSTNAKDILMSDDVSDEDFKNFIEVFSL